MTAAALVLFGVFAVLLGRRVAGRGPMVMSPEWRAARRAHEED